MLYYVRSGSPSNDNKSRRCRNICQRAAFKRCHGSGDVQIRTESTSVETSIVGPGDVLSSADGPAVQLTAAAGSAVDKMAIDCCGSRQLDSCCSCKIGVPSITQPDNVSVGTVPTVPSVAAGNSTSEEQQIQGPAVGYTQQGAVGSAAGSSSAGECSAQHSIIPLHAQQGSSLHKRCDVLQQD